MSFYAINDLLQNAFSQLESRLDRVCGPGFTVKTGFSKLDELTGGLKPGELVLISGWKGVGKSAFCHNIAQYCAVKEILPVAIFSPGINKEELLLRMISSMTGISIRRLTSATFEAFKWGKVSEAIAELYDKPLYIDDTQELKIEKMANAARELANIYAVRLIIIDNLQYIESYKETIKRKKSLQALKNLAQAFQVPLIATVDLCDTITRDKPCLSDLQTAGVCGEEVDTIIFIHRSTEGYPSLQDQKAEIIISKQNQCRLEISFELTFTPTLLKFERDKDKRTS